VNCRFLVWWRQYFEPMALSMKATSSTLSNDYSHEAYA
jgi:hypothetical protein